MRFLVLVLLLIPAVSFSANYTKCASGCDYTSIATAIAAIGSTDTIQLLENTTESIYLNKQIGGIWVDLTGTRYTWTNSVDWASTLEIGSSCNGPVTFTGLDMYYSGTGGANVVLSPTTGASESQYWTDCVFNRTATGSGYITQISNGSQANMAIYTRCRWNGNAYTTAGFIANVATASNCVSILSGIFSGMSAGNAIEFSQSSSNIVASIINCTIDGNAVGYRGGCAVTCVNTAFTNNTTDLTLYNHANHSQYTYCGFSQQTNTGDFGAGCIFGVSAGSQYVGSGDFHLLSRSSFRDAGTTNAGGSPDFDKKTRPQNTAYCIGAYEYVTGSSRKRSEVPTWWFSLIGLK